MAKRARPLCAAVDPFDMPLGPFRDTLIAHGTGPIPVRPVAPPYPDERPIVPRHLPENLRPAFSITRDALFWSGLDLNYDRAEEIAWRIVHEENLEMLP